MAANLFEQVGHGHLLFVCGRLCPGIADHAFDVGARETLATCCQFLEVHLVLGSQRREQALKQRLARAPMGNVDEEDAVEPAATGDDVGQLTHGLQVVRRRQHHVRRPRFGHPGQHPGNNAHRDAAVVIGAADGLLQFVEHHDHAGLVAGI